MDQNWFDDLLKKVITDYFSADEKTVLGTEMVIYTDCCSDTRNYERITDLTKVCSLFLTSKRYNNNNNDMTFD